MASTGLYSQHLDNVKIRYLRNAVIAIVLTILAAATLFPICYMILSAFGPNVSTAGNMRTIFPARFTLESFQAFFDFNEHSLLFQKVRYIVWPLVKPTTLFLLITGVIGSFQVFMNAYIMTGGGPDNSTTMIGLLIYRNAFERNEFGMACAQAILLTIVIAIMSLFQFKAMGVDVEY